VSDTSNLEDGMRTWLGGVAARRKALQDEREKHQRKAVGITSQIAELDRTERRYKIALGMSPARQQRKAEPAAITAERDALRAGLEWLRDDGADVDRSIETEDDGAPIYYACVNTMGSQDRSAFYANLAAACGHPALAQLVAEGAETEPGGDS
jgi:hypothetical protein